MTGKAFARDRELDRVVARLNEFGVEVKITSQGRDMTNRESWVVTTDMGAGAYRRVVFNADEARHYLRGVLHGVRLAGGVR